MTGRLRAGTYGGIEIRLEKMVGGRRSAGPPSVYFANYKFVLTGVYFLLKSQQKLYTDIGYNKLDKKNLIMV